MFNIGINNETRVRSLVPFPIAEYYEKYQAKQRQHPFAECLLVNVEYKTNIAKDPTLVDGVELEEGAEPTYDQVIVDDQVPTLVFTFEDPNGDYTHIESIRSVKPSDKAYKIRLQISNAQIAQIYDSVVGEGKAKTDLTIEALEKEFKVVIAKADNYTEAFIKYYNAIADKFAKVEYNKVPLRLKLVRQGQKAGRYRNSLQFGAGNFIEPATVKTSMLVARADEDYAELAGPKQAEDLDTGGTDTGGGANPWATNI